MLADFKNAYSFGFGKKFAIQPMSFPRQTLTIYLHYHVKYKTAKEMVKF